MTPDLAPIVFDGRPGLVAYLDARFEAVEPADAVLAKITFEDGSSTFYSVTPANRALGDVEGHPFHGNQWTGGGGVTESSARTIEKELTKFQADPANKRSEISAAINRTTGEIIFRNDTPYNDPTDIRGGGVDDAKYIKELDDAGEQNVLHYHTHPDDNAFSDGDWKVLAWSHMGEMRVVTNDHIYTLTKTPKFNEIPWQQRTPAVLQKRWNDLSDELWDKTYADQAHASTSEMVAELTRRINHKMADEYGVTFSERPRFRTMGARIRRILGGAGSGNFGHAGRPGTVGGSGEGGGNVETDARQSEIDSLRQMMLEESVKLVPEAVSSGVTEVGQYVPGASGTWKALVVEARSADLARMQTTFAPTDDLSMEKKYVQRELNNWAETSGDHSLPAITMQVAAQQEFGLKNAPTDHMNPEIMKDVEVKQIDRAYLRSEYEATQKFFAERGITHVSLFRGQEGPPPPDGRQTVTMQPESSWTTNVTEAHGFATRGEYSDQGGYILTARVPVERILSTPLTGRGCLSEEEVILLGGPIKVQSFNADPSAPFSVGTRIEHSLLPVGHPLKP
jgi:hypothetical protein